jgi:hypothetical protein
MVENMYLVAREVLSFEETLFLGSRSCWGRRGVNDRDSWF